MPRYRPPRKRVVVPKLKSRYRVKAWRQPNEDNPTPLIAMARASQQAFSGMGRAMAAVAEQFDKLDWGTKKWPST